MSVLKLLATLFFLFLTIALYPRQLDQYNVVWTKPSTGSHESMPCGGGSIGMNVWVENKNLYFYFSHSGAFDENNAFLKGGRMKLQFEPNPFESSFFRQELKLKDGYIEISAGEEKERILIDVWADVFRPVINLNIESEKKIAVKASYESWRYVDHLLRKEEGHSGSYKANPPSGLTIKKDSIFFDNDEIWFVHKNGKYTVFDETVKSQKMESVKDEMLNPLAYLTFGGKVSGKNFIVSDIDSGKYKDTPFKAWNLESKNPSQKHDISIYLHNEQTTSIEGWKNEVNQIAFETHKDRKAKLKSREWWNRFWQRSFIEINPASKESDAWKVGRNYQLFRYMLGCNAYGSEPTKFNGGLFTFDPSYIDENRAFTPDFRLWGGGTMTAQNQRLVYFPMIKSGDFDMMKVQFDFYKRMLKNAELRSSVYWGHEGACFTEQIENFGLPNISEDRWKPRASYSDPGVESNPWLEYTWDTVLEFALMMFDVNVYNNEPIQPHLHFIESVLTFFDEHYRFLASRRGTTELDENGHLIIYPGSSCETYKMATNATSTVAALNIILKRLLELDDTILSPERKERWAIMQQRIPPLSYRQIDDKKTISPAKMWERVNNTESPQLYPVFPWRIYGVNRPDIEVAVNTYLYDPDVLKFRSHIGWKQDNIFAACLGLTEEARKFSLLKMGDGPHRFPAFWGPGFDWTPDHNWGGSGMIGLQEMLAQTDGDTILLLPAWPVDWDVHFKLHMPANTTVELKLENGKVTFLEVIPSQREKDIIFVNSNGK